MLQPPNEPLNQSERPTVIPKTSIPKIVRIALFCVIAIMGTAFSFVLYNAFGWVAAVITALFFIGIGFLANFIVVKVFSLNFGLGGGVEHIGVLTKKWSLQETVTRGSGDFYYGDVYYVMLNERMFKIGDNRHGRGWQQYENLQLNKTYKLKESSLVPGFIVSIEEVKTPTVKRSTDLGF